MGSLIELLNLYCEQGKWKELTFLYQQIRKQGFQPNSFTFSSLLKLSSTFAHFSLHQGQSIHADATKRGFVENDSYVINSILIMYAQFGSFLHARKVFDDIPLPKAVNYNTMITSIFRAGDCNEASKLFNQMQTMQPPNDITWSAMISGFAQNGRPRDALCVFKKMRGGINEMGSCLSPNSYTIASAISACGQLRDLCFGKQVHGYSIKISSYVENDVFVGSSLIDLYGKCGQKQLAELVFDSLIEKCVVAWSVILATYVRNGCPSVAIEAFRKMVYDGVEPNYVTLSTLITACSDIPNLILGKELHGFIVRRRSIRLDTFVLTSLIDMYSKCHCMPYACHIFGDRMGSLEWITTPMWNAMISGYVENNNLTDALELFRSMTRDCNARPNSITMAIVLPLCGKVSFLLHGKEAHCYALKTDLDKEILVANNLLDMYSKCGKLLLAENQFDMMIHKNQISWTSMISGYGMHGDGHGAIRVFQRMVRENAIKPDHVTFVALISSCSHAGLVEEGLRYFREMRGKYGIIPKEENYGSVVDLLGRAGRLDEAKNLIRMMPIKPSANVWGAFLGACRIHGNVKEAENAAEKLLKLEPEEGGFRKLLSSIYLDVGRLDSVLEVRNGMREMSMKNRAGYSWVETSSCYF